MQTLLSDEFTSLRLYCLSYNADISVALEQMSKGATRLIAGGHSGNMVMHSESEIIRGYAPQERILNHKNATFLDFHQ